ncbi:MAG TPA: ShlB/FhaC/HecB family hemolysin secretion/activation protein [Roseomonas sp.]
MAAATALIASTAPAVAQVPPPPPPGRSIEDITPREPPRLSPGVTPPAPEPQRGPGEGRQVTVSRVTLQGNTALTDAALRPAVAPIEGQTVTLARVEQIRLAIVTAYRNAGYAFVTVAAALSPDGPDRSELRLAVTEGYVAEVRLEGDIGPAGTQVLRFLNTATEQRPVRVEAVERALLLASDVPGVTVRGLLQPIQGEPGALRLVAQVSHRLVSGFATADNRAYRLTGPWQGLIVAGVNSLTEFGERTELALFGSERSTQWFLQGSLETFIGASGLRMRLYAGTGVTEPTGALSQVGYRAETQIGGISLTYPVIRSRPLNLYAVGQFDIYNSLVENESFGQRDRTSRDAVRAFRAGFDLQFADTMFGLVPLATNIGTFRVSQGAPILGGSDNEARDPSRQTSIFDFTKITGEFQRTQPLFSPFTDAMVNIQGLVVGQWSNDVLPASERYFLGGNRIGRGYYAGQAAGDRAYGYAVELQLDTAWDVPITPFPGSGRATSQFYLFYDYGRAVQNLESDRNLKAISWGFGVRTVLSEAVSLDLEFARRLTRHIDGEQVDPLRGNAIFFRTLVRF